MLTQAHLSPRLYESYQFFLYNGSRYLCTSGKSFLHSHKWRGERTRESSRWRWTIGSRRWFCKGLGKIQTCLMLSVRIKGCDDRNFTIHYCHLTYSLGIHRPNYLKWLIFLHYHSHYLPDGFDLLSIIFAMYTICRPLLVLGCALSIKTETSEIPGPWFKPVPDLIKTFLAQRYARLKL